LFAVELQQTGIFYRWTAPEKSCTVYYSIYIAPHNSHGPTEALLFQLAPRKETSFKKRYERRKIEG